MISHPLISIIVPVYNVEKYLQECLDSVLAQTYKNLEIILIDDGSTDNCPQICDDYAAKDKRIKVIHQKNQGVSAARNAGLKMAKGEYIGFVDSDDYIKPDMYEYLYQLISKDNADMAMCNMCQTDTFRSSDPIEKDYLFISAKDIFNYSDWMLPVNKLYKSSIFYNIRFQEGLSHGEDAYAIFKIIQKISFISLGKEAKYYYRQNNSSACHKFKPSHLKELQFMAEWIEYAKENNLKAFYTRELQRRNSHIARWFMQLINMSVQDKESINYLVSYLRKNWFTCFFVAKSSIKNKCFLALCCVNFPLARFVYKVLRGNKK